jgi:hypothetical protein
MIGRLAIAVLLVVLSLGVVPGIASAAPSGASGGLPGQSATRLPDGRWLLIGGADAQPRVAPWPCGPALGDQPDGCGAPRVRAPGTPRRACRMAPCSCSGVGGPPAWSRSSSA